MDIISVFETEGVGSIPAWPAIIGVNILMRTPEQIVCIKSRIIDPYSIENFISADDVKHLIDLYNAQDAEPNKVYKNTGPVTVDIKDFLDDVVIKRILEKLRSEIGNFEITAGLFFWTNYPHIIHNDDTFELPDGVYRAITIPLKLDRIIDSEEFPKLCFFDQFYFHGPAKFFNGDKNIPTYFNKQVYEYSQVHNVVTTELYDSDKLFTHLKAKWLKGLSLHSSLPWVPGNAIIFDSVRLHCASDFRRLNITSKLGISIFTTLK